jgi:hypothetical protein
MTVDRGDARWQAERHVEHTIAVTEEGPEVLTLVKEAAALIQRRRLNRVVRGLAIAWARVSIQSLPLKANCAYGCMAKEEAIEVMAKVLETLPNAMFRVELEDNQASSVGAYLGQDA